MLFSFFGKTTSTLAHPAPELDLQVSDRSSDRNLLVLSDDRARASRATSVLQKKGFEVGKKNVTDLETAISRLVEVNPARIVLFLGPNVEKGLSVLKDLRDLTDAPIHAVGPANDSKLIIQSIRLGADEFLDQTEQDWTGSKLLQPLTRKPVRPTTVGKGVAVVSSCGGCGVTTTAVNLAYELLQCRQEPLLIDLAFDSSDMGLFLDFRPKYAMQDLARKNGQLDRTMLERAIFHHSSNLAVLPSSSCVHAAEPIAPEAIRRVTNLSRSLFQWVVADLGSSIGNEQAMFLQESALIVVLFRLEFPSLVRTKRLLDHFGKLGVELKKVRLIANRTGQPGEVSAGKVQKALRKPIYHRIPDDAKTVNYAVNNGSPVALESARAKITYSYRELAQNIVKDFSQ